MARRSPKSSTTSTAFQPTPDLPETEDELIGYARSAADDVDRAVLTADESALTEAWRRYDSVVYRLNGDTSFGCRADDDAPGTRLEQQLAAEDLSEPGWGQTGRFVVEHGGIRAAVCFRPRFAGFTQHLEFHAIDLDRVFISETGYRSHFLHHTPAGITVAEAARFSLAALIAAQGLRRINPDAYAVQHDAVPWAPRTAPPTGIAVCEAGGQMGFGF